MLLLCLSAMPFFFFFNDTATTEIYTLSLHDALPICPRSSRSGSMELPRAASRPTASPRSTATVPNTPAQRSRTSRDRKSTRLNSSHANISYAVFCLKKKNKTNDHIDTTDRDQPPTLR